MRWELFKIDVALMLRLYTEREREIDTSMSRDRFDRLDLYIVRCEAIFTTYMIVIYAGIQVACF